MPAIHPALKRLREICLALPDTKETLTWGKPHFRVGEKIFCGFGEEDGRLTTGFKLTKPHHAIVVKLPGFWVAPYVGRHGWVSLDVDFIDEWDEVADMILESYRLIAPKKSLMKLEGDSCEPTKPRKSKKKAAKTPAVKKTSTRKSAKKKVSKKKDSTKAKTKRAKKKPS